uniref:26S proteasome non-ATPase regulatory subunit 5 n=1 Tax=Denticeps clupeoides TaxID=299321 RepID=A0AAY4A5P8_9TELE
MAASIESLLSEISRSEDPMEGLKSLRTAVFAVPAGSLREALSGSRLEVIFSLLDTNDREQVQVCVDILGRVLQAQDPTHLYHIWKVELENGLQHPDDSVKVLTLAQAISTLVKMCQCKAGLDALFSTHLGELKNVMATSDVIRYRVYELVVDVSSVSPVSLGYCANSNLISQLLQELTGDDILVRATAIEMVTCLAESQHGRQHLAQQGIMDQISNMIVGAESDPFSSLYLPGLVKFFGKLALMDSPQHVCECFPAFLKTVSDMVLGSDDTHITVALDTLGALGSTVEGKQVLHKTGGRFNAVLKKMSQLVRDGPTELRVRCLDAIAQLLTLPVEDQTEDLCVLLESWFCSLSSEPMEMFRNITTQPFPELHCGALRIFSAIATQAWGQKLMLRTPGFVEWTVDRSSGTTKEAKDAKFELVGALASSPTIVENLGSQNALRLRSYLKEGPYYVNAVALVSTEGGD